LEKPSGFPGPGGLNPPGIPGHAEERPGPGGGETWKPGAGTFGQGTTDNSVTEEAGWSGRPKPKPGNVSAAAGGGDKPWLGGGGKPTTLPQPSRPVAGVGGGNEQGEGASVENWPDQARPLPDHSSNVGIEGDERPGGGDEVGLGTGMDDNVRPTVPGAQGSSEAWSTGGGETNNDIGNLGTAVGPGSDSFWNPEGTAQHPDINGETTENNVQNIGTSGGNAGNPDRPLGPTIGTTGSNFGTPGVGSSDIGPDGAPESITGNTDDTSGSLDGSHGSPQGTQGSPQETHGRPQGTHGRPQETLGRPIVNPGTQGVPPGVPGGILGRPEATPTGPGGEQESHSSGSSETPVGSSGTSQGTFGALGGSTGSHDVSLGNQDGISGTQAGASNQGSGSPSGSLGTLGAESGSPGVFGEASGGTNGDNKKPWSGGIIGEDGQNLLDGVESIHNSSHNIVNIFSENENVSIFSEDNKLDDFESTIEALASGNSTVSNGLKAAILNYMPSLKWLFVFIDN